MREGGGGEGVSIRLPPNGRKANDRGFTCSSSLFAVTFETRGRGKNISHREAPSQGPKPYFLNINFDRKDHKKYFHHPGWCNIQGPPQRVPPPPPPPPLPPHNGFSSF